MKVRIGSKRAGEPGQLHGEQGTFRVGYKPGTVVVAMYLVTSLAYGPAKTRSLFRSLSKRPGPKKINQIE